MHIHDVTGSFTACAAQDDKAIRHSREKRESIILVQPRSSREAISP